MELKIKMGNKLKSNRDQFKKKIDEIIFELSSSMIRIDQDGNILESEKKRIMNRFRYIEDEYNIKFAFVFGRDEIIISEL